MPTKIKPTTILNRTVSGIASAFKRALSAALLGIALLAGSAASAQTNYYWDSNDNAAGFGTSNATWTATTIGTATSGWSTDSNGVTAISGNSVTTTTDDSVYFGTPANDYPGTITFSGPLSAKSVYAGRVAGSMVSSSTPVITFPDDGVFEVANPGTYSTPAGLTLTGATNSLKIRPTRTLNIATITNAIPNTSKIIVQTSPDSPWPYPGRLGVNASNIVNQLGPVGTPLVFDRGTLRFVNAPLSALPYTNLSGLHAEHPLTFTPDRDFGIDNQVNSAGNATFTIDMAMNLGAGFFWAETRTVKLTLSNNWAGVKLSGGTVEVNDNDQLGPITAPLQFGSGEASAGSGALRVTNTTMTSLGARPIVTTDGKGVNFDIADAANVFTLTHVLAQRGSAAGFSKTGQGTLILSGNNSFGGGVTVGGGTLRLGHTNALGFGGVSPSAAVNTSVSTGFTLDLNGMPVINEVISLNGTGIGANGALINNSGTPASIGSGISMGIMSPLGAGSGLSSAPAVTIGGSGSGATATASLGLTTASFTINVTGDKLYSANPTVTITGGGGFGAAATPVMTASQVTGLTITAAGFGYTSAPTAIVSDGTCTNGGTTTTTTFTGNALNFCVGGLAMTSAGSGYTSNTTTVTITGVPATVTNIPSSVILNTASSIGGSGDITIDAEVRGANNLTKVGAGQLTLSVSNTYSGVTTVSGGTLVVGANALSAAAGALGNASSEVGLGVAGNNTNASILIGGAFDVGRNIRIATANTTDAGTRVLTLGGNTAQNSIFSGNIFLGTASQAGRGVTLTAASGGQVTFSGVIQNPGSMDATTYTVTKSGLGTVILANTNTYTGDTTVSAGTLLVNGSIGTNTLTVQANATLGGTGTIKGVVTVANGGTLAPGTSIGTLTNSNNLVLDAGSTNTFEVDGSGSADQVVLGASVTYGGVLNIVPSGAFTAGQTFTLFSGAGATTNGNFSGPILGSPGAGLAFSFTNGVLSVFSTISEPAPATLTNSFDGVTLSLTWPVGEGWVLKNQTNSLSTGLNPDTNAWFTVPGGVDGSNSITIDPNQPTVFYRLVWP